RMLLTNLVLNAVDAMPHGGTITLGAGVKARRVFLSVRDTGVGMDAESRRRCFDPFFTTKGVAGTGLGLTLSWSVAQRLGGGLNVVSELGHGSTFTLWLPAVSAPTDSLTPEQSSAPFASRRILLIDDQPEVAETLSGLLTYLGHHVVTTNDGWEGLSRLQHEPFDTVVTDLGMPGLDGRGVAQQAKQIAPQVRVILLTGWGEEMIANGDQPEGVDRVVAKPVSMDQLREVLAAV